MFPWGLNLALTVLGQEVLAKAQNYISPEQPCQLFY